MSSMWRRAMLYLGLGPDEEYEYEDAGYDAAYDEIGDVGPNAPGYSPWSVTSNEQQPYTQPQAATAAMGSVRPLNRELVQPTPGVTARPSAPNEIRGSGTVRPVAAPVSAKPHTVCPDSFNEVQEIADRFMARTPVIMNLQGVERDLSRRFVDFASGLCYGLSGHMERVANQVYLLSPSNVEISHEDRQRITGVSSTDR